MTGRPAPDRDRRVQAVLVVLATCAGLAAGLWLAGQLSAVIFGHGWPRSGITDAGSVLVALPRHLDDPAAAWPAHVRHELPGPAGFYLTLGLLITAAGALALAVVRRVRGGLGAEARPSRARLDQRGARWARPHELRPLVVRGEAPGRVILGRVRRRLVATEQRHSAIVIAPTQSLKTTGLAIPALLEWRGPAFVTSVKTDVLRDTRDHRATNGDVKVFDPAETTGMPRASWTPLAHCSTWQGARRTAERLAHAGASSGRSVGETEFWSNAATKFLAPLLFAAALDGRTIADVVRWIDLELDGQDDVRSILDTTMRASAADTRAALASAESVWNADDRLRSSLYMTAAVARDAYNDPAVIACSRRDDLSPAWLLDGGAHTAYLCAPQDEQRRLRPLFVTLLSSLLTEVYARATRTGRPLDPGLLLVLDEVANIAPLPDLDAVASTAAGQGIQLVTVVQDLAQMRARWGDRAATIVNNHRAKLIGAGTSDTDTLDYVSRLLADEEIRQTSATSGDHGRRSTTESSTFRSLAPANVIREGNAGTGILIYGGLPPAHVRLRPWFAERKLRRLVYGVMAIDGGQVPRESASTRVDG
jgi:type IV secretion system protein VirD4